MACNVKSNSSKLLYSSSSWPFKLIIESEVVQAFELCSNVSLLLCHARRVTHVNMRAVRCIWARSVRWVDLTGQCKKRHYYKQIR